HYLLPPLQEIKSRHAKTAPDDRKNNRMAPQKQDKEASDRSAYLLDPNTSIGSVITAVWKAARSRNSEYATANAPYSQGGEGPSEQYIDQKIRTRKKTLIEYSIRTFSQPHWFF